MSSGLSTGGNLCCLAASRAISTPAMIIFSRRSCTVALKSLWHALLGSTLIRRRTRSIRSFACQAGRIRCSKAGASEALTRATFGVGIISSILSLNGRSVLPGLPNPIANIHADSLDVLLRQKTAMHNDVAGFFESVQKGLRPLHIAEDTFELRPVCDYD